MKKDGAQKNLNEDRRKRKEVFRDEIKRGFNIIKDKTQKGWFQSRRYDEKMLWENDQQKVISKT